MNSNIYLITAFIWKYKETLEEEHGLSMDEAIYMAQDIVKDYLNSDEYSPKNDSEIGRFLHYVSVNLSEYI